MARHYQELLDTGIADSRADLARQFKVSRPAITILMNLLKLAPEIQAHIGGLTGALGELRITETECRGLIKLGGHREQLARFRKLLAQAGKGQSLESGSPSGSNAATAT